MIFNIFISSVLLILITLYIMRYFYCKKIREIRDNIDFTTNEGKLKIEQLNYKLDRVNGYRLYNRK